MSSKRELSVSIVMRSFNDEALIGETLAAVRRQRLQPVEMWNCDSSSTDSTLAQILRFNDAEHVLLNEQRNYNPGRVLNEAVSRCRGDIIVFINSDATPQDDCWLQNLVAPFADPTVAATYGRQIARRDARSLFVKDTERAFGDGSVASRWVHFFSLANSAVRREAVASLPFETRIQYSEDIEWSYRIRRLGHQIRYVRDAVAMHSHNYTLRQSFRRHHGEGTADAWIFQHGELAKSFWRYCLLPFGMEVMRDMLWALRERSIDAALHSVPLRATQKWARWRGLCAGDKV